MEEFEGNWMKVAVDSNLQQTILLDNRNNAVWDATREIILTYSVPYYKTSPPPAAAPEGAEAAPAEIPPWMRKRAAEAAKAG